MLLQNRLLRSRLSPHHSLICLQMTLFPGEMSLGYGRGTKQRQRNVLSITCLSCLCFVREEGRMCIYNDGSQSLLPVEVQCRLVKFRHV